MRTIPSQEGQPEAPPAAEPAAPGSVWPWVLLLAAHAPLGHYLRAYPAAGLAHSWGTFLVGALLAAVSRRPKAALCLGAYISCSDVLWRMTEGGVRWDFSKYALIGIIGIMLARVRHWKNATAPVVYLALLTPAVFVTLYAAGFSTWTRQALGYNLSGPVALAVCSIFFAQLQVSHRDTRDVIFCMLAPIISVSMIAAESAASLDVEAFHLLSNWVASGGFGPNQVSALLGLGAMLCLILHLRSEGAIRWAALPLALWLMVRCAMTFSRGGLANMAIGLALLGFHSFTRLRYQIPFLLLIAMLYGAGAFVALPRLEQATGGMLSRRFSDTSLTGRDAIMRDDLRLFASSPWLGVGAGRAVGLREVPHLAAHTEYSRLLAEHGIFGVAALAAMMLMAAGAYRRATNAAEKAWTSAMLAWAAAEMSHSATRIAATSFVFGLAFLVSREGEPKRDAA